MKTTSILQRESPTLRLKAKEVEVEKINTPKIKSVIAKMKKAVHAEDDGVAIAAPQIGESLRIFVVASRAFAIAKGEREEEAKYDDQVFINPVLTKFSKKKKKMEEGCLSVRWLYGKVLRSERVFIKSFNERGEVVERGASGLLAQIFQHEVDHLDGVLFIDKAEDVEDLPPKDQDAE